MAPVTSALGDMVRVLANADPAQKAKIYAALGLRLTYHPDEKKVLVGQTTTQCIGGRFVSEEGAEPTAYANALSAEFVLGGRS